MANVKILIVEDEGIEALDLQHRLTGLGYVAPDIVATGEEAITKAGETRPDLIVMDIMLRGEMDGVTAAGQIHDRFDIPVIFITAYADDDTLGRAKITEPYGYLVKPFKEKDLHISIDMALYKHKMERDLKESKKWFATTLSSIGDAVIATDKNGLITFMNQVAEELTGWKMGDGLNKQLTEVFNIINMVTRKPVENPVAKVMREGVTVGLANHTVLIARDGAEIIIDDSAAPIKDDRGNIIGSVLVFRDVTARKQTEVVVRKSRDELQIANKELEAFIYSVSHDLRAPLRHISGFAKAVVQGYTDKLDAQGRDYLDRISKGAEKMSALIDDLLHLSKISRKEVILGKVDLSAGVSSLVAELRLVNPRRDVQVEIRDSVAAIADPGLMKIVLSNIVSNAWKFTSQTEKARIEFGSMEQEGKTVYYVKDNGVGFDQSYANKMFLPFHRLHTEKEFEGTGIGLTIVERLIHRHGGKVWAEGKIGKGATVFFTLERQKGPPDEC
jgi:PAS domain S-box-containing protein